MPVLQFSTTGSPVVDKAIRQLTATSTFLREIEIIDSSKTKFLSNRIKATLNDIRHELDKQREYDVKQLDETTKFSTTQRPDVESLAQTQTDFILHEVRKLLKPGEIEVYEVRVAAQPSQTNPALIKENTELKAELKQKSAELQQAQTEISRLTRELAGMESEKTRLTLELKAEILKSSGLNAAIIKLRDEIAKLEQTIREKNSIIAAQNKESNTLMEQLRIQEEELAVAKARVESQREISSEAAIKYAQELASAESKYNRLNKMLKETTARAEIERERAIDTTDQLKAELKAAQDSLAQLEAAKAKLDNNLVDTGATAAAETVARDAFEALQKQYDSSVQRIKLLESERDTLQARVSDLQSILSAKAAEAEAGLLELQSRVSTSNARNAELSAINATNEAKVKELNAEISRLTAEYAEKLKTMQPAIIEDSRVSPLESRVKELESALQTATVEQVAMLRTSDNLAATQTLANTQETRIAELSSRIAELSDQLSKARDDLNRERTTNTAKSAAIIQANQSAMQSATNQHQAEIAELNAQINKLRASVSQPASEPAREPIGQPASEPANALDISALNQVIKIIKNLKGQDPYNLAFQQIPDDLAELHAELPTNSPVSPLIDQLIRITEDYQNIASALSETVEKLNNPAPVAPVMPVVDTRRIADLEQRIADISQENEGLAAQLNAALEKNKELTNQVSNINNQLSGARADLVSSQESNAIINAELANIKGKYKELKTMLNELMQSIEVVNSEIGVQTQKFIPLDLDSDDNLTTNGRTIIAALKQNIKQLKDQIRIQNIQQSLIDVVSNISLSARTTVSESIIKSVDKVLSDINSYQHLEGYNIADSIAYAREAAEKIKDFANRLAEGEKALDSVVKLNGYYGLLLDAANEARSATAQYQTTNKTSQELNQALEEKISQIEEERSRHRDVIFKAVVNILQITAEDIGNNTAAKEFIEEIREGYDKAKRFEDQRAKDLTSSPQSDSYTAYNTDYNPINNLWQKLNDHLPTIMAQVANTNKKLAAQLGDANQQISEIKDLINNQIGPKVIDIASSVGADQSSNLIDLLENTLNKVGALKTTNTEQVSKIAELEKKVVELENNVKVMKTANERKDALNAALVQTNKRIQGNLNQALKSGQTGQIPGQLRTGATSPNAVVDELPDGGDWNNALGVSGGAEPNGYVPMIAGATAGLLWWGLGGLLVFILLLMIYYLGREIYKTQFKNEVNYNVNTHKHGHRLGCNWDR